MSSDPNEPRLRGPGVSEILAVAGLQGPISGQARSVVLAAMRNAAEKRVEGVTKKQRRRCYGHAALLVAACAALDSTPAAGQWVAGLRSRYSRYPALQRELTARRSSPPTSSMSPWQSKHSIPPFFMAPR